MPYGYWLDRIHRIKVFARHLAAHSEAVALLDIWENSPGRASTKAKTPNPRLWGLTKNHVFGSSGSRSGL